MMMMIKMIRSSSPAADRRVVPLPSSQVGFDFALIIIFTMIMMILSGWFVITTEIMIMIMIIMVLR